MAAHGTGTLEEKAQGVMKSGNRINLMSLVVSMAVGGVETQVLSILERLARTKYNVMICCIKEPGALAERARNSGIEVISLDMMKSSRFSLSIPRTIAGIIKSRMVQVLWTHQYVANLYGRMATFLSRRPAVISTFHALYDTPKMHRSILNRLLSGRSDALVAVSGAVASDMKRYDHVASEKIKIIHNGTSLAMFNFPQSKLECRERFGLQERGVLIGTVGRLSKEKNHAVMLEALDRLPASVQGVIVGDGPMKEELLRIGGERCRFLGSVEHASVPYLLKALDIFCFPSLWEGFGISLVEAMASGLPVIASDIAPHRDIIGDAGIFFPAASSDELAAALTVLISDSGERERLGGQAKARSLAFSIENTVAGYEKIIKETLRKKGYYYGE